MSFLGALIPALLGGALGLIPGIENSSTASGSAKLNEQIAQQEMNDKQQLFQQLAPFFSSYLGAGSPYLQNIQRAGSEQNAQQQNNAAGQFRQLMGQTGLGYGPSGATAAGLGQMGQQGAAQSANTYLQNLLNNEQVKFQAAQGLTGLGQMMSGQNTVGASPQPVQSQVGSSLFGLSQILGGLTGGGNNNPVFGTPTNQFPNGVGVTTGPMPLPQQQPQIALGGGTTGGYPA